MQLLLKIKIFSIETQARAQLVGCGPAAQLHTGKVTDKKTPQYFKIKKKKQNRKYNYSPNENSLMEVINII